MNAFASLFLLPVNTVIDLLTNGNFKSTSFDYFVFEMPLFTKTGQIKYHYIGQAWSPLQYCPSPSRNFTYESITHSKPVLVTLYTGYVIPIPPPPPTRSHARIHTYIHIAWTCSYCFLRPTTIIYNISFDL